MEFFGLYVRERSQAIELIKHSNDNGCLSYVSPMGYTVFHLAAEVGDLEFINLIFEKGLDISRNEKITPLHLAVHGGHVDVARCIIENTRPRYRLLDVLKTAFFRGDVSMVNTLLECGAMIEPEHLQSLLHHTPEKLDVLARVFLREITKNRRVRGTDLIFSYEECRSLAERCAHRCVLCVAIEIALRSRSAYCLRLFIDAHNTHPSFCYDSSIGYPKASRWFGDRETGDKVACAYHGDRVKVLSSYLMSLVSSRLEVQNIEELIGILLQHGASATHQFTELRFRVSEERYKPQYNVEPTPIILSLISASNIGEDAFLKLYNALSENFELHPRCFVRYHDFVFMGYAIFGGHLKVLEEVLRHTARLYRSFDKCEVCKCYDKQHTSQRSDSEWLDDACVRLVMDAFLNMGIIYTPGIAKTIDRFNRIMDIFMDFGMSIHSKIEFGRYRVINTAHMSFLDLVENIQRNRRDLLAASDAYAILHHIKTHHQRSTLRRLAYMLSK